MPYITAHGNISKALEGIMAASVPPKVSGDFVKDILGIKGGSGDQVTSYLKKIGLADSSGSPTSLYNKLRNPSTSGAAVAEAMRIAYKPLFDRSEYCYNLNDDDLKGLIIQETGQAHDSNPVKMIFSCFKALNGLANFETSLDAGSSVPVAVKEVSSTNASRTLNQLSESSKLNIGYNIHLNLPATDDIAVFNAIFKSLRENLLSDEE